MIKRKLLLTIEGNIGAGKSYLISTLKDKLKNNKSIIFFDEPVKEFSLASVNGNIYNPLKDYYKDPVKFAFSSQSWIHECYKKQLQLISEISTENDIIIMDRGIYSTTVFIQNSLKNGFITRF